MTNAPPPGQQWQTPTAPGLQTPGPAGQSVAETAKPARQRPRIPPRFVIGAVVIGLFIWFVAANTHDAKITLWVHTVSIPVWIVLIGSFLIGWGFGVAFRKRRQSVKAAKAARRYNG